MVANDIYKLNQIFADDWATLGSEGKLITIHEIRQLVAKKHKANVGCHITCGIFAWIVTGVDLPDSNLRFSRLT